MIDPKSKAFLKWTQERLLDDDYFEELIREIFSDLSMIYSWENRPSFIEYILKKMLIGAKEHGKPKTSLKSVVREQIDEMIDLIGWKMMERWIEDQESNSK